MMNSNSIELCKPSRERPNLFIVGVPKAATTTLCEHLGNHKEIFLPEIKEPNYLALPPNGVSSGIIEGVAFERGPWENYIPCPSVEDYKRLYLGSSELTYRVDGSTQYAASKNAPNNIARISPDAKIILQLREPLDRAISAYNYAVSKGDETKSFLEALNEEAQGLRANRSYSGYVAGAAYGDFYENYLKHFGEENIMVTYFEDFKENPKEVLKKIYQFLELDYDVGDWIPIHGNQTLVTENIFLRQIRILGRRFRNTSIGKSVLAKNVHKFILSRSKPALWKPNETETQQFYNYLKKLTCDFTKEVKYGVDRYVK